MKNPNEILGALSESGVPVSGIAVVTAVAPCATFVKCDDHIVRIDWSSVPSPADVDNTLNHLAAIGDLREPPTVIVTVLSK